MAQPYFQRSHESSRSYRLRQRMAQPNALALMREATSTPRKSRVFATTIAIFGVVALSISAALFGRYRGETKPIDAKIDRIVVEKSARKLSVFQKGRLIRSYRIALGSNPTGPKEMEGDMKTPEGLYTIDYRNPQSDFHLALHISYPDQNDVRRAVARDIAPGCDIMIHGLPNGHGWIGATHRQRDWTAGCIALTDPEIEELWRITSDGTPIEIRP
jgi:L,D-transpeptidase-like protein